MDSTHAMTGTLRLEMAGFNCPVAERDTIYTSKGKTMITHTLAKLRYVHLRTKRLFYDKHVQHIIWPDNMQQEMKAIDSALDQSTRSIVLVF